MTITVGFVNGQFIPRIRDQVSVDHILRLALFGSGDPPKNATAAETQRQERETAKAMLARSWGRRGVDFTAKVQTTASETGQGIDLTDQGVTFPASKVREIEFASLAKSDNDQWYQRWRQTVWGDNGTTPVLVGDPQLIYASGVINGTEVAYGRCRAEATYAGDTATAVSANSSQGSSLGNNSTNTITLTHPISRATPKHIEGVNACPDVATATEQLHVQGTVATATTFSMRCVDLATPSADGFDDVGTLTVNFFIVPPPSIFLTVNSNNVELHVGHDASDTLDHLVEVYCGPALNWTVSPTSS